MMRVPNPKKIPLSRLWGSGAVGEGQFVDPRILSPQPSPRRRREGERNRTTNCHMLVVICVSALLTSCGTKNGAPGAKQPSKQSKAGTGTESKAVESGASAQGWTAADREQFYHLDMGGEIIPLDWLQALESSRTGKPFLQDIERFGLLSDPENSHGLPVGLTVNESRDSRFAGKMVGLNCAACHTAEITYQGRTIRIDGGAGMFDATAFATELTESIQATVGSSAKLIGFLHRLLRDKSESVPQGARDVLSAAADLDVFQRAGEAERAFVEHLEKLLNQERAQPPASVSHGLQPKKDLAAARDGLHKFVGEIRHGDLRELLGKKAGTILGKLENRETALTETLNHVIETTRLLIARVEFMRKMKSLSNLPATQAGPGRTDDFATARNVLFDEQFAIGATAPCSIPPLWNTPQLEWSDWDGNTTSAMGRSMATALAAGAPFDPKTYLSTVPARHLFEFEELTTKLLPPKWPGDLFGEIDRAMADRGEALFKQHCAKCHVNESGQPPDLLFSLAELGTDPTRATNFAQNLGDRPFADALRDAVGRYMDQAYTEAGIGSDERTKMEAGHSNQWRPTGKYASRSLAAVWATAPYLHNGSVPSLYDLLHPAARRPQSFTVGHREFDPVNVGLATPGAGSSSGFVFDTTIAGNSNAGHEFGIDLPVEDRMAIIEYLKVR